MKNVFKVLGRSRHGWRCNDALGTKSAWKPILFAIALVTLIAFSMAACDDGGGGPQTATYTGASGGATYTLKITETARYTAKSGDAYELAAGSKRSRGTVSNVSSGVLTLVPSNSSTPFNANVSGTSLTSLNGTVTWTDNTTDTAPGALTGGSGGGGGTPTGGGGKLTVQNLPAGSDVSFLVWDFSGPVTNMWQLVDMAASDYIAASEVGSTSPVQLYDIDSLMINHLALFGRSGTFVVQADSRSFNMRLYSQVRFTNGNATINWNSPSYAD
jgi:hypothetical protein